MAVGNVFFVQEFDSTTEEAVAAIEAALAALVGHRWISQDQEFTLRLCLEEAFVNAVQHGNQLDPNRKVRVEMVEEGDKCTIRVRDEGCGFEPKALEMPNHDSQGGRGVCLIKHFMDNVEFNSTECCLEMTFKRRKAE